MQFIRILLTALATAFVAVSAAQAQVAANGVVRLPNAYSVDQTVTRLKADIAKKGIMFFISITDSVRKR